MFSIGIIVCEDHILSQHFPTKDEPNFLVDEPPYTPDDYILIRYLRAKDIKCQPIYWNRDNNNYQGIDCMIMRSPWDYMDSLSTKEKFLTFIEKLEFYNIPVCNHPSLLKWLTNKSYLKNFQSSGINVVPSIFFKAGENIPLLDYLEHYEAIILKPTIAACGNGLIFIKSLDEAKKLGGNQYVCLEDMILQKFIPEIKDKGEWSLVYIDGKYSHSVLKKPPKDSILVHAERGGTLHFVDAPKHVIECANTASVAMESAWRKSQYSECYVNYNQPLYIRFDILENENSAFISEVEGVEPELYFRARKESVEEFYLALLKRLNT